MSSTPSVLVVIVNYRTPKLVVDCLRSLLPEVSAHGNVSVAVVDNASGDGSVDIISEAIRDEQWSTWARVMPSSVNGGFAYGNNYAVAPALASDNPPDYVWLLNPDTVVLPGALRAQIDFLESHPRAGICGGGMAGSDGTPWPFAFRFPSLFSELDRAFRFGPVSRVLRRWITTQKMRDDGPERVDWICGANMMIRRQVFETIGLMDEEYFLYFEETDYCLQAQRAGFECWYLPQSRIIHISGQSSGVTGHSDKSRRLPSYWYDSRRRYFVKNHGRGYAIATDTVWIAAYILGRIRCRLQFKPNDVPPHFLADFFRHSSLCRSNIDGGVVPKQ